MLIHRERERIKKNWKEFMKATLKFQVTVFSQVGFPSNFFKKSWVPHTPTPPVLLLEIFPLPPTPPPPSFLLIPLSKCREFFAPSETFKLLSGCQYGRIVRRIHTKVIRQILLLTSTRNTEEFAKIVNNLSFYFENLGTAIFKERFSVPVSITKNFHCKLQFLF